MAATSVTRLRIAGMDCGSCALTIEQAVGRLPGVARVRVDFTTETLEAHGTADETAIASRVRELGYRVAEPEPASIPRTDEARGLTGFIRFLWTHRHTRIAVIACVLVLAVAPLSRQLLTVALMAAVIVVGAPIVIRGLRSLVVARRVTIDLLMGLAAAGAVAIGETGEAAAVVLLYTLGEALEAYGAERSRRALRALLALQPQEAMVLITHDHHGHAHAGPAERAVVRPIDSIRVGERLFVKPGARIPLDGRISEGSTAVNEAAVTGEGMPVDRTTGDLVMGGTINGHGAIVVDVLRPAAESTVSRIARLVERALAERAPAERFVDRFARWYTPAVVLLAVSVVVLGTAVFGQPLLGAGGDPGWLYRGLALLIIACPCALIISIPVTVVSALTRLAQLGVLVKGGARLDRLADVAVVAFDKTGTLTAGEPRVTRVHGRECGHDEPATTCLACDEVVAVAASVESGSEHPLGRAVLAHAREIGVSHSLTRAANVRAHAGQGVSGELAGARITIGRHDLFAHDPDCREAVCASAAAAQKAGRTVLLVGRDTEMLGFIGVEDEPRAGSAAALQDLRGLEPRPALALLTGDAAGVASGIAARLGGFDMIHAGLLPEHKQDVVRTLQSRGAVAMVGDGINDAPALAQADVGIAMGASGTAQAMETADVVLMGDDPRAVALALRVARRAREVVKQNIVASLALKIAFLALAVAGIAGLWAAVLADVGATLLVTLNGMRLLRAR